MTGTMPTVGRIVWYFDGQIKEPQAAIVAFVHPKSTLLNLTVFDHTGEACPAMDVLFRMDGYDIGERYACWPKREEGTS